MSKPARYIVSHSVNMDATRLAIEVLTARANSLMDDPVANAMRRIVARMRKNLRQLEKEDRENSVAQATWDGMDYASRCQFLYRDRAQLDWLELETWERSRLVYRMIQIAYAKPERSSNWFNPVALSGDPADATRAIERVYCGHGDGTDGS